MSADELETALAELRTARDMVDGEAEERLDTLVGKVERALDAGRTLDHGALARITRTLEEVAEDADEETASQLLDAKQAVSTYREGVPGA
ncbi:DUF7553 family protein [Natronomonas marina]|jgi:hypothetical protein|uniref:DUF7553 family protein n=1 Tax=Natronomonas marina TaxID=2961939 RepID=UPI0020CA1D29|nr:hypothetical protein [Natronomonas marina]